jgi:hypothetical protein
VIEPVGSKVESSSIGSTSLVESEVDLESEHTYPLVMANSNPNSKPNTNSNRGELESEQMHPLVTANPIPNPSSNSKPKPNSNRGELESPDQAHPLVMAVGMLTVAHKLHDGSESDREVRVRVRIRVRVRVIANRSS